MLLIPLATSFLKHMMTEYLMAGCQLHRFRIFLMTDFRTILASVGKITALRPLQRPRHIAKESNKVHPSLVPAQVWSASVPLCIRMRRLIKDLLRCSLLHNLSCIHDHDIVCHLCNHAKIMCNRQELEALVSPFSFLIRSRICACIVTSSAVVGSSAIRSLGSAVSAIAIIIL